MKHKKRRLTAVMTQPLRGHNVAQFSLQSLIATWRDGTSYTSEFRSETIKTAQGSSTQKYVDCGVFNDHFIRNTFDQWAFF